MATGDALDPEDNKLVVLARATRARTGAEQGAAVRDLDGRTYAAATVSLAHLRLSALAGCLVMAVASGSRGLEAAVVLGGDGIGEVDLAAVADFAGGGVPVHHGDPQGHLLGTLRS